MTRTRALLTLLALCAANGLHAETPGAYSGHGAESVSASQLEQFRPKPLQAETSRRIQNLLDLRPPGMGQLSPDGRQLFFTWRVTGVDQIWRLDGQDRFPVQMTAGEDRSNVADVTPDGKWLIVSRDRKGEEYPGLYLQASAGGPLLPIQHLPKVQTQFAFVSDDSAAVFFLANDQKPDSYALYRYDIASGKRSTVFDQPGLWSVADHAADGRILMVKLTGSKSREYFLLETGSGKLSPLFGQGEKEEYEAAFGKKKGELLVLTPKFGEFRRLYRWNEGKFTPITAEQKWDVQDFEIDRAAKRIYYSTNEAGYLRSHVLDAATLKPLTLPWPANAEHQIVGRATRDGRYVVLGVATPDAPRQSYVWDWQKKVLTRWITPSAPEEDTRRFAAASLEHYVARDGTRIPMFVRRPAGCADRTCPVIVHFHGGPESQTRPGFSPVWQLFVDAGFIFAEPNVRGSDGYGKTWVDADNGARRLDVITDIQDAALWIRKNWSHDGNQPKIGIFGGSYGGYSTLVGMTMFAGTYDAGVSVVGMANLLSFLQNTAPYRRALRISEYGDPDADREALVKLSPVSYIGQLKAPLLIIQGANDPRVPVGEAVQMFDAAKARGAEVELMIFADEGHGAGKRENQALEYGHTLRFFQTHLK